MSYLPRAIEDCWLRAAAQFPVLLLTGPRQVGKTTLLRHLCGSGRRYVTLDDPALRLLATQDPALFLQRFPPPVLIDEIQYAVGLLPYVKMHVDAAAPAAAGGFWLTGSQQFHMMQGVSETLAGRVAIVHLLGFSQREATARRADLPPFLPTPERLAARQEGAPAAGGDLAAVYAAIWRGAYPALVTGRVTDRDLFYGSYVQTYLQRDVQDLVRVGDQAAFLRFLKAAAARTAQMLNVSELARDVGVSVPTARAWLSVLEASFQVHLLRPYHSNVTKRLVKAPKLYFLDTGLCAWLTEWTTPETLAAGAMAGAIFETYAVAEILKSWWHRMTAPPLYYYRDRDGTEIDLLFVQDRTLHPVEIKRAATPRPEWARPFATLERFPERPGEGAVICLTPDLLPLDRRTVAVPIRLL